MLVFNGPVDIVQLKAFVKVDAQVFDGDGHGVIQAVRGLTLKIQKSQANLAFYSLFNSRN